ncbi:MAG: PLP-dependent aminotransferase family protein [Candidatus Nanopelagicales bacterium]|nr:PLP-dependent aminotransferase family protein [Candidatus Nanopelagicales bacterium]MDZ4248797.1 PLP-dependent aminotransferase family protein [Candidatus Nanopelagicales bacterium]
MPTPPPGHPHGSRLDPWVGAYAQRARSMAASEIRALFAVASRPEVVSLAGGMPFVEALPLAEVADTVAKLIRDRGEIVLQYGSGQGDVVLREQILDVMSDVGIHAHSDDVVVTTGSQMALDLVVRVFCDPGDVVLVEAPSYVGALGVFRAYECDVVHVPMDSDGLIPAALEDAIRAVRASGRKPKLIYTVPTFHNPAGVTLPAARRHDVLELAQRENILLLEDDPYCLLGFDGTVPRAMRADDPEQVVYLGSFSKTIASGLRVGWAVAPHGVREKLVLAAEAAVLCPSNFTQGVVSEYLATQPWRKQVDVFRELYKERRDALLSSMSAHMPAGTTWTVPGGGFYSWVTLPPGLDATAMLPRAVAALVAYVPGTGFFADGQGRQNMRLSYCNPTAERIREGVRRLATVLEQELQIAETFGTATTLHTPAGTSVPAPDLA